jgi:hypothetical protein
MLPNEMTSPQSFSLPRADWASSVDDSVVYKALLNRVAVPIVRAFVGVFWFCIEQYGFASVMPHCRRETSALKVMQERAAVEARTAAREAAKPAGEKEEKEKKPAKQPANPMQRPEEDVAVEHNKVLSALVSCVYHSNYPPATLPHHHFGKPENRASTVDYLKSVASFAEYQTIGTLFPLSPQNYNSVHAKTYEAASGERGERKESAADEPQKQCLFALASLARERKGRAAAEPPAHSTLCAQVLVRAAAQQRVAAGVRGGDDGHARQRLHARGRQQHNLGEGGCARGGGECRQGPG